jgi:hypothetical protein
MHLTFYVVFSLVFFAASVVKSKKIILIIVITKMGEIFKNNNTCSKIIFRLVSFTEEIRSSELHATWNCSNEIPVFIVTLFVFYIKQMYIFI